MTTPIPMLDLMFFLTERVDNPRHVGAVQIFRLPKRGGADRVREIVAAGLVLLDVVEPEWKPGNEQEWGGWSPLRGAVLPGTAIFVTAKA